MSSNSTKKRRVAADGGGANLTAVIGAESAQDVHNELIAMKSTMNELLDHTRDQTENMKSMMKLMSSMQEEMNSMRKDMISMKQKQDDRVVELQTNINESIEEHFDQLNDKCNYHEALLESQKWKYSAPRPSEEYWNNLEEDNPLQPHQREEQAEQFLVDIKEITEKLRYGTGNGDFFMMNMTRHHDELLPHWKELAKALEQYQYYLKCSVDYGNVSTFQLSYVELSDEVINILSKSLQSTYFNELILQSNHLGQGGIDFVLDYLESNENMTKLGLAETVLHTENMKRLCDRVKNHPSIENVELLHCTNEEVDEPFEVSGYDMLQMLMTAGKDNLESINLSGNRISTGGGTFISDFLAENSVLEELNLSTNQINDNDARAIADALKHNTTLRFLNLRRNRLSEVGWKALSKAVFDKTSLNSAADSNHCCYVGKEDEGFDSFGINSVNTDPKYVRQKKIYSILSSRNIDCSNVDYFDEEMAVELLPDMVKSIQRYSKYHEAEDGPPKSQDDVIPLSIMYEVLQRWDKSLAVFESLSS